ncbi:MAG TPA: FGGY-family carbohydrate kinase [Iamia sp.]|nr:FGGY-family carbohydrate kinase [Iamia sp.]
MSARVFGAVDIGASGGRVIAGVVDDGRVELVPVHRFPNGVVEHEGHLRWDLGRLVDEVEAGLRSLGRRFPAVESIGIDTWAVDYARLGDDGAPVDDPIAYRDDRTAEAVEAVHAAVPPAGLFARNGLQHLPFTTLYQLAADRAAGRTAGSVVLLPDVLAHRLTGALATEVTNASTTGLLAVERTDGARHRPYARPSWDPELLALAGVTAAQLPPLEEPGTVRGPVRPDLGLPAGCVVTTVGSHDTASAVVAVPATTGRSAYVISGTWSLVGVETAAPVLTEAARLAGFSNEAGVDGRTRLLRNVGGLWLLQECLREWGDVALDAVLDDAAAVAPGGPTIDVDDPGLIPPGRMPARIAAAGGPAAGDRAALVRCILDSLAAAHARTIDAAATLTGRPVDVVHVVGGGSQNALLCQLTADACHRPVVAGPVEATALGNVLVQARAHGALSGTLEDLRAVVAASTPLRTFHPRETP